MASNTLDMNKLKEGRLDFQFCNVYLRSKVSDSALMMLSSMKADGVEAVIECDEDLFVSTDALSTVFLNLMTNAFKLCKQGRIRIIATHLSSSNTVEITIEDTGRASRAQAQALHQVRTDRCSPGHWAGSGPI
jgi:signal transduction histidine kinase